MEGNKIAIDEETKALLNTPLPDSPCSTCKASHCLSRTGNECVDLNKYKSAWNNYDYHHVLDYAIQLRLIRRVNKEIKYLLIKVREIIAQLPKEVIEVLDDEIYCWPKNVFGEDINNV